MKIKKGVSVSGFDGVMLGALSAVDSEFKRFGKELVVTSGKEGYPGDGVHGINSLHYLGRAFDCRTRPLSAAKISRLTSEIQSKLGVLFDVVNEGNHIHVELDPKTV